MVLSEIIEAWYVPAPIICKYIENKKIIVTFLLDNDDDANNFMLIIYVVVVEQQKQQQLLNKQMVLFRHWRKVSSARLVMWFILRLGGNKSHKL